MREHSDVRNYRELESRHVVRDRALRDYQATTGIPKQAQGKDRRKKERKEIRLAFCLALVEADGRLVDPTHLNSRGTVIKGSSAPPFPERLLIYALVILLAVGGAVVGVRWLGLRGEETLMVEGAVLFLVAGSGRAPRLFAAVRKAGEFRGVSNDRVMGNLLFILAVLLLLAVLLRRALSPTT